VDTLQVSQSNHCTKGGIGGGSWDRRILSLGEAGGARATVIQHSLLLRRGTPAFALPEATRCASLATGSADLTASNRTRTALTLMAERLGVRDDRSKLPAHCRLPDPPALADNPMATATPPTSGRTHVCELRRAIRRMACLAKPGASAHEETHHFGRCVRAACVGERTRRISPGPGMSERVY
jgi:hypothetical protein